MSEILEFKKVQCKDCYRCLRECPIKAISFVDHHAQIIEDRCILCGKCIHVCPQNAKIVHQELPLVETLLQSGRKVIASVAPSFVSNLGLTGFGPLRAALRQAGFFDAEETARGAEWVTREYQRLLEAGGMKNFITSACPSACRLIQEYFPQALPYLAPVASPMVAHARLLREQHPDAEIVFIGPCLAKKREALDSGIIANVLTFAEVNDLLERQGIDLRSLPCDGQPDAECSALAKGYPVTEGIIRSFTTLPKGYRYLSVDGPDRCMEVLENIENYEGVFMEINTCPGGCINGPCGILPTGGTTRAKMDVLDYVDRELAAKPDARQTLTTSADFSCQHPRVTNSSRAVSQAEIEEVLHKTGKMTPADELNCGTCGYRSCRGKAWAVINGYADIEICLPYMRERAESLAIDIVHNSPEGIILVNGEMNIVDANATAMEMLGMSGSPANFTGRAVSEFFPPLDFYNAYSQKHTIEVERQFIPATRRYVNLTICYLKEQRLLFGQMKDITEEVNYNAQLDRLREETIETTDKMIMKQMRVAQEIASLLGETTAETKVALLNLKKMLQENSKKED